MEGAGEVAGARVGSGGQRVASLVFEKHTSWSKSGKFAGLLGAGADAGAIEAKFVFR